MCWRLSTERSRPSATISVRADPRVRPGGVPEWPIGTALKAVAGSDVSRGFESRLLREGCAITAMAGPNPDRCPGTAKFYEERPAVGSLIP
jgi:hypothetical protein